MKLETNTARFIAVTDIPDTAHVKPTERPIPRALAGWPEGSIYVPRVPVLMRDLFTQEHEDILDHRRRRWSREPEKEQER